MDRLINLNRFLTIVIVGVIALNIAFVPTVKALLPFTEKDVEKIYANETYRDPEESLSCSVNGTQGGSKSVYLLGDSWLERITSGTNTIENVLANSYQLEVVGTNSSVGRNISSIGGTKDQTGLEAVTADEDIIKNVGAIVIILGTNPDDYARHVPELIEAIRNVSSAEIFWVNTSANRDENIATNSESANRAINVSSTELDFNVIDFYSMAFPYDEDPETVEINTDSPLMDRDGIHPKITEGTDVLMDQIGVSLAQGNFGGSTEGSIQGSATRTALPEIAKQRLAGVEERVEQNRPVYEILSAKHQLPWQIFGALHYREAGSDPSRSMLGGERLGETAVDSNNTPLTLESSGDAAYGLFTSLAKSVYDVDVGPNINFEDLKLAFLAYHRGFLYARVPESEGGPWGPDIAPYVMNLFDEAHIGPDGNGMVRPVGTSGTIGVRGVWGETVSGVDNPAGAMTFLSYFGYSAVGSFYGGGCDQQSVGAGQYTWPVIEGSLPSGRITACWSDLRNKIISGGSYYHSGIDIAASAGTDVVAAQSGRVVFADENPTYGNLVIIDHGNGTWTHYGHLDSIVSQITVDVTVAANDPIGKVGNTGISLGNHLHFNMYNSWPFGSLPEGAANSDGTQTINPFTNGLSIPSTIEDEAGCSNYPDGGREVDIEL